ncbi:WD40-repeat-containing domain protein [Hypomontagnella monticulosa]|nr:WD40-repeat-containing domain protein [Hypomontagnella monticulosa]
MAIDKEASLWPTNNLLLREGRKHYRTSVSPIHWQLRSLVSAERQDIVYFPAGANNTHIQRLDTSTRECETIKVISFHPRCLVASKGWICCGGENGEFVVIRESGGSDAQTDTLNRDVISRLNSLDTSNLAEASMYHEMINTIRGSSKTWTASSYKVGTERVNCITIWHPPKSSGTVAPWRYDTPVAVVANNDKTVTVVGLYEPDQPKDTLEFPDCVNRGVISPDGSLLVAICDDPYLYIHLRRSYTKNYHGTFRESHKWVSLPRIKLKGGWTQDTTDCRGSFAACFSPSGKYLAVGTQYGTISIFDTAVLKDPESDPLVTHFDSDRAPGEYGAVRDMAFSPGPHDLLAWSEHRGRIGVADARTNFARRQIISLDDATGFHHVSLNDASTIDPRLLDPRSERSAERDRNEGNSHSPNAERMTESTQSILDLWDQATSDRPLPNPNADRSDATARINQPFSSDEVAVLEAFQNDRRRRETRDLDRGEQLERRLTEHRTRRADERALERIWRSSNWSERRENLTRIFERQRTREARDQHRSSAFQTPPEDVRERGARRSATLMHTLAQNVDNISQMMANRMQSQRGETTNESSTTSRERASSPWFAPGPSWADLETDDHGWFPTNVEPGRTRRGIPMISDVWSNDSLFSRIRMGSREHRQHPDDTAGMTWSEDGQVLYVAAEDGIYKFRVNLYGRKVFPDVALR